MSERNRKDIDSSAESGKRDVPTEPETPSAVNTDEVLRALEKFLIEKDALEAVTSGRRCRFLNH